MTDGLKPCPFCGSRALYEGDHNLDGFDVPVMFCNRCKALVTFEGYEDYVTAESDGMTELRAAWNVRAKQPTLSDLYGIWKEDA